MKRTSWKIAIVCCVAVSLSSIGLFDRGLGVGTAPAVGGEPPHGGGGKGQAGGAAGKHGGSAPRGGQGGGIRVPSVGGSGSPSGGHQPNTNRAPAVTRPNIGGQPGSSVVPPPANRPGPGVGTPALPPGTGIKPGVVQSGTAIKPGVTQPGTGIKPGVRLPGSVGQPGSIVGPGSRGNAGLGTGAQVRGSNRPGIVNQALGGNTVNLGQRSFNIAPNNYQPTHANHSWYRGYWGGFAGPGYGGFYGPSYGWGYGPGFGYGFGGGYAGYGYRPLGWGWGNWGLGALIYNSGYLGYWNPYYTGIGSFGGYNYSQPIPVVYVNTATVATNSCRDMLDSAVAAFRQNDYDAALDLVNRGIAQCPNDAVLHEFRALVLFARSDYQQAAATIHSVLAVGPGWDWATLSSLYGSVAIYTNQLRALESFTKENPDDAASRFLLAYHYMSTGHPDAAARHLQQVVKLMPNDRVAADVLKMISATPSRQPSEQQPPQPPAEPKPTAKSIDPAMLVGTWKATRDDGSNFVLDLTKEATFTWKFSMKENTQEFSGTYKLEGNVLALERKDGGSLIAVVTPDGEKKFNFKMLGAPGKDPGLDFGR